MQAMSDENNILNQYLDLLDKLDEYIYETRFRYTTEIQQQIDDTSRKINEILERMLD